MTSDSRDRVETVNWRRTWYGRTILIAIWLVIFLSTVLVNWLVIDGRGTQGLWHVVDDMCRPILKYTGHPFPCLEMSPEGGWAVIHAPFDGSQFLVVPLARVTGIEDPDTRAHSANESLHIGDFLHAVTAEALVLTALAEQGRGAAE